MALSARQLKKSRTAELSDQGMLSTISSGMQLMTGMTAKDATDKLFGSENKVKVSKHREDGGRSGHVHGSFGSEDDDIVDAGEDSEEEYDDDDEDLREIDVLQDHTQHGADDKRYDDDDDDGLIASASQMVSKAGSSMIRSIGFSKEDVPMRHPRSSDHKYRAAAAGRTSDHDAGGVGKR